MASITSLRSIAHISIISFRDSSLPSIMTLRYARLTMMIVLLCNILVEERRGQIYSCEFEGHRPCFWLLLPVCRLPVLRTQTGSGTGREELWCASRDSSY